MKSTIIKNVIDYSLPAMTAETAATGKSSVKTLTLPTFAAASAGDYVSIPDTNGNTWAVGLRKVVNALEKNTLTFPAKAAATEGDFVQLTDATGGKWALTLDVDGGGVANAGPLYTASTPIIGDISGATDAASVALIIYNALTVGFLAKFNVTNNLDGTITFEAKTPGVCLIPQLKDATEAGAGSITNSHVTTGASETPEPTGALWVAATAARRAMCDVSGATTAAQMATAVQSTLAGLTGIGTVITVGAAAVADIPLTHVYRAVVATPTPKNSDDSGAGSITAANTTTGVQTTISITADTITSASTAFTTGQCVRVAISSGSLPTPLAAATDYYIIKASANTFKLAKTYAQAIAGTYINITDYGTADKTMTFTQQNEKFPSVECLGSDKISFQANFVYAGADDSVGTLSLEVSNDDTNWCAVSGSAQSFSASVDSVLIDFNVIASYVRCVTNITSGSGASMSIIAVIKNLQEIA